MCSSDLPVSARSARRPECCSCRHETLPPARMPCASRVRPGTWASDHAPSWPGTEQVRFFALEGRVLTLKTPPIRGRDGVKLVQQLVWERA